MKYYRVDFIEETISEVHENTNIKSCITYDSLENAQSALKEAIELSIAEEERKIKDSQSKINEYYFKLGGLS